MAISAPCPKCERVLNVPDVLRDKPVRCAVCGTVFIHGVGIVGDAPPTPAAPEKPPEPDIPPAPGAQGTAMAELTGESEPSDRPAAYGEMERDHQFIRRDVLPHRANVVLVIGILSIVSLLVCNLAGIVLGIVGWTMANADLAQMRRGLMDLDGRQTTNSGKICSIIGLILNLLLVLGCLGFYLFMFLANGDF